MWPKDLKKEIKMEAKKPGLKMMAANGTAIENLGQKRVKFWGKDDVRPTFGRRSQ